MGWRHVRKARVELLAATLVAAVSLAACSSSGPNGAQGSKGPAGAGTTTTAPVTATVPTTGVTTTRPATTALTAALDEAATLEGASLATYQAVVARLGAIAPFTNVAGSEEQHLAAVQSIASHYGLTVPTSGFRAPAVPSTRTAACQLGVTTERHVISSYDGLIGDVSAYPDVVQVFTTLQHAAEDSHLPAFEHCA